MGPLMHVRLASWQRSGVIAGVCVAALLLPSLGRAADPVEKLRTALRISPTSMDVAVTADRTKKILASIAELKTISHRRRAYFLTEWSQYLDVEKNLGLEKNNAIRDEMDRYRTDIGKGLKNAIFQAAEIQDDDNQLALAILIAEIAEADQTIDTKARKGKFARGLTPVVAGLMKAKDDTIRQAALNALGKMTPEPKLAIPIIEATLKEAPVGPRRLAAYALVDLAKNSQHHQSAEELQLLRDVIRTAEKGLRDAGDKGPRADEPIRGYCLQAIQESARVVMDKFSSEQALLEENEAKKKMSKEQAEILEAYQAANPVLVRSLADPKINVRLAALQALEQISTARSKITRSFEGPDPLEGILKGDWKAIARLLKEEDKDDTQEDQVRLRRSAIAFFEQLGPQAEPAVEAIVHALRDEDRFVKWAATRTIRNLPPESVGSQAIYALAYNLLIDGDHDLSGAAAEAIEALGTRAQEAVHALGIVIANGGADNRSWDAENRVKAMAALASIGGTAAHKALPQLMSALSDPDVRIRREAAQRIGELGRPADAQLRERVLSELRKALGDGDQDVRTSVSEAILILSARRKQL